MIKISASLSQKRPLPGVEYSSCQIGAAMEIEVSDADGPEAVRDRIQQLYQLLNESINQQFAEAAQTHDSGTGNNNGRGRVTRRSQSGPPRENAGNNGNGRRNRATSATQAQQRAVFAIAKSLGLEVGDVVAGYGVADVRDLTVRQASELIDDLKAREARA